MSKVAGLREEIIAKQKAIAEVFASKPDKDFTEEEVSSLRQKNAELNDLGEALEKASEVEEIETRHVKGAMTLPGRQDPGPAAPQATKSLGELFTESVAFKGFSAVDKKSPAAEIDLAKVSPSAARFGMKTLLTTTGYPLETTRIPGLMVQPGEQQPSIADLLASGRTGQAAIVYMEETTTTNAAAETDEGGQKPESALAFTERTSPVRKIATVLPVTDELMQDAPAMEDYVNSRLGQFIAYREDSQLLNGDGNAPNIKGILNTVGIQTQAKGADPVPDAFYKAIVKVATGAYLPADAAVAHPLDWQDVRLLRTVDGIYIWGSPAEVGPNRIWGVNVTLTTAIAQNTALVGAFRAGAQVFRRSDIAFAVSDSHSDFFIKNQLMIRAEERLALVVFRPAAFCTVTGI
jgi:HK97 family phage major capsid protein